MIRQFFTDENDESYFNICNQMDEFWSQMSDDECSQAEEYACDLHSSARDFRQELEEWWASFELFRNATQSLHHLYPHPDPLTLRDLGQVCRMAEGEIIQSRQGIQKAIEELCTEGVHKEPMVAKVLDILRPVDPDDRKIRLTKVDYDPDAVDLQEEVVGTDKYPALRTWLHGRSSDDGLDEVYNDLRKLVQNHRFK